VEHERVGVASEFGDDEWDAAHIKDGLRLITAFGLIEKTKCKKVVALAESMVLIDS
jgi:hypothetical protein